MDFRRIPFQFSSTDPAKRHRELQKRFGLPDKKDDMYIDFGNPDVMGPRSSECSSATSSPRLQHRVPIFMEGASEPIKTSVDSQPNSNSSKKPHVRVIPIEIEGADSAQKRHRTFSGPVGNGREAPQQNGFSQHLDHSVPTPQVKSTSGPRVCNIPIKIENSKSPKKSKPTVQVKEPVVKSQAKSCPKEPKQNGCNMSKPAEPKESPEQVSLKKIDGILEKLKEYQLGVEKFSGTIKQKEYRYLDEMLTRCMLQLDDIDTMGNEKVRLYRKSAVKQVQACVDLLESKVNPESSDKSCVPVPAESMEAEMADNENVVPESSELAPSDSAMDTEVVDKKEEVVPESSELAPSNSVMDTEVADKNEKVVPESSELASDKCSDSVPAESMEVDMDSKLSQDTMEIETERPVVSEDVTNTLGESELQSGPVISEVEVESRGEAVLETEPIIEEPVEDSLVTNHSGDCAVPDSGVEPSDCAETSKGTVITEVLDIKPSDKSKVCETVDSLEPCEIESLSRI